MAGRIQTQAPVEAQPTNEELRAKLADVRRQLTNARVVESIALEQMGAYRQAAADTSLVALIGREMLANMSQAREEIKLLEQQERDLLTQLASL